jgi:hypothetical protein
MPIPFALGPAAATVAAQVGANVATKVGGALITGLLNAAKNGTEVSSLADISRPARVEPLVIIDKTLANQPYMEDVLKLGLSTYTGYYMQAVSMIMNVGRIDTLKVFDSLNPNRSVGGINIKDAVWSTENWNDGLPSLESFSKPLDRGLLASLENYDQAADGAKPKETVNGLSVAPTKLYEIENLAVGKLLNVELRDGNQVAKIPVLVRLVPTTVPPQTLTHIFTAGGRDSWTERYHLWRAGQIRLVRDLMLGLDLIDEHRKALINDKSGAYSAITDRRRNNVRKAALSGSVSMADASNIAVISSETAKQMAAALYGKLENPAVRKKIFDNSYLLLMMVVNEKWERVTVYHRGMDLSSDYSFKEIKASEKGKGPDITELLKLFLTSSGANI